MWNVNNYNNINKEGVGGSIGAFGGGKFFAQEGTFLKRPRTPAIVHYKKRRSRVRRYAGICTFIVALIIHGVAQFLISRRLPLIDAALAPPRGSNLHTERKGKVLTQDTRSYPQTSSKIQSHVIMASFSFYFCPFPHNVDQPFVFSSLPLSLSLYLHKEANKSTAGCAQVRLFIKKFLLRLRAKHTYVVIVVRGFRLEKPVLLYPAFLSPSLLSFGRYYFTILYYILRSTSNFACLDLTRTRPEELAPMPHRRASPD